MSDKKSVYAHLVCPETGGELVHCPTHNIFVSPSAKLAYPIKNNIPIMLPQEAKPLSDEDMEKILKNK